MERCHTLVVGAGVSGLSYANFTDREDYLILEAQDEIGGYCRTVVQDGFTWDYSGHFFHFRHPEVEAYLVSRMADDEIKVVTKSSKILYGESLVDFPFQKNIHQLPKHEFIDCLYDLFFREERVEASFRDMLLARFGRGICEKFLFPYNEKLYACDLGDLDHDAMGRFFPHADLEQIVRNFREPDNASYNTTFTYPSGGAVQYVNALASEVPEDRILLSERLVGLDLQGKVARTDRREIGYERVVSSIPFNRLLDITGLSYERSLLSSNKVLVFNLGFDTKGWQGVHWVYFPERKYCFYRVGFYDNIFDTERLSLYVEIGLKTEDPVDEQQMLDRVMIDLKTAGVVAEQRLVSHHAVVLDPAYVHIETKSQTEVARTMRELNAAAVYSIGRYGGWKYCAIEDHIVEARELVESLENRSVVLEPG